MKRLGISALLALSLTVGLIPASSASVTPGSKCSKVGDKQIFKGNTFTCVKSGTKLVWGKGVKAEVYDAAFAKSHLGVEQQRADQIMAEAKLKANQLSSPPNCTTRNSIASVSLGEDGIDKLLSLIFKNSGICDLTVRASAAFLCPDGSVQKTNNYVTSAGIFPLRAGEKLSVSLNVSFYFPQVLNECRSLTRYSSNSVRISTYHQPPSIMTLTSNFSGSFNQVEATKKANQFLANEKTRADKIIADAKNPVLITKAWTEAIEIDAAQQRWRDSVAAREAEEKAAADKVAAGKASVDAGADKICVVGASCKVGNTGPGGGIVFYDAGSQQSWGRYLEVAPEKWFENASDPRMWWCVGVNTFLSTLEGIGSGKGNTDLMLAGCSSGAAVAARNYQGGAKSDWFLPSKDEMNELYKYSQIESNLTLRNGFVKNVYCTSTESGANDAWLQGFLNGRQVFSNKGPYFVRPIRAF